MRLAVYGATSVVLGAGVIISAFNQRANFYSACVHLAQSNACLMVLTNLLLLLSILFGHALQLIFYGPLRTPEIENLYEKAWYAVTETCLAMTIFRDEFDVRFIVMFGVLLFIKCFCWIGGSRVEFMETSPPDNPTLFHIRLASSLLLLLSACLAMLWHSVASVLERGRPNMMVMFAFEFAILLITSLGITGRYVLSLVEKYILKREAMRRSAARVVEREDTRRRHAERTAEVERRRAEGNIVENVPELEEEDEDEEELDVGGWEEKGTWVFYLELVTDLLKLLTYLSFFSIVLRYYGLPLHIIRDVYLTLRSFITRIRDFIRYRRATAHMNSRYPDATPEEVEREGVCIICREEMRAWTEGGVAGEGGRAAGTQDQRSRPKKLPCGHVLHFACLRSWLERQQRCPTCRRPVLDEPLNGAGGQNGQAQPNAAGGGLAFGGQIGPLGFDIGVGGPGFVQNLMNRMNEQQRPQQQQQQPQQQQGQGQQQPHPQPQPQLQPQPQPQPHPQQQQQQQNPGAAGAGGARPGAGAGGGIAADIEQHIIRTRQLLDRELAMLEITQRQLWQLQELRVQAQAAAAGGGGAGGGVGGVGGVGGANGLPAVGAGLPGHQVPATPVAYPAPAAGTPLNLGAGNLGAALQGARIPGMSVYHGGPVLSGANASAALPQGMVLPPGWNVVSLTVPGAAPAAATTASPPATPGGSMSLSSAEAMRRRRGQQSYRERMADHHARLTPTAEISNPLARVRPALNRATTAPSATSRSASWWATQTQAEIINSADPRERLSEEQIQRLSPTVQRSIATISRFAQQQLDLGDTTNVYEVLAGLPENFRDEVLRGWPDRIAIQELALEVVNYVSPNTEVSASTVAVWVGSLPRDMRVRVILGLPEGTFRELVLSKLSDEHDRTEVAQLSAALRNLDDNATTTSTPAISQSSVSSMIESISDWTQVSPLDETSSREDVERAERETREIVNRRVQVLNDISRAMRSAAGQLEQVSGIAGRPSPPPATSATFRRSRLPDLFNTENSLSLFGDQSIFARVAQEEAQEALERDVVEKEREWRNKRSVVAVEGLLGGDVKGKGKAKAEAEEGFDNASGSEPNEGEKEKEKVPAGVTVEDVDE